MYTIKHINFRKLAEFLRREAECGPHRAVGACRHAADLLESEEHELPPADAEPAREPLPDIFVRNDPDNLELMQLRIWAKNALRIDEFEKLTQK